MRNFLIIVIIAQLLALTCSAQVAVTIAPGIPIFGPSGSAIAARVPPSVAEPTADIVHYKFNEGSGTTFTADVGPDATTSGGSGYVAGADTIALHAFNFGGDTTATSDSAITYGVNVITVTFWAYNTAWGTGATPLLNSSSGSSTANTWMIDNDEGTVRCIFRGTTVSLLRYESFPAPSNNAWHHFAVVFDGSTATGEITVYVDGASQSTTVNQSDRDGTSNFDAQTLYIGNAAGPVFWGGYMDDIRIYGNALSAGQIAAVYANPE